MANDIEEWLTYAGKGTGIAIASPFLAGFLGNLWSPIAKTLFTLGGVAVSPALFVGAAAGYFLVEMLAKALK